ncbi:MAG: hypothetical protein AMXMBFR48_20590 [Ignavibacteriales bacterium]
MESDEIIRQLNLRLSQNFPDYQGVYFFGSRLKGDFTEESDYDVVLIFDELDYPKRLEIAGVLNRLEYELDVFFDCKLFTTTGTRSIKYIRENVNPIFIHHAIDQGRYYARP